MRSSIHCSAAQNRLLRMRAGPVLLPHLRDRRSSDRKTLRHVMNSRSFSQLQRVPPGTNSSFRSKPAGTGRLRIHGVHDRQRDHDRARPRRHLVEDVARQQHHLRRNRRDSTRAGYKSEQAEVDLDVAVGGLNAAEREDAVRAPAPCADRRRDMPASFSAK